MKKRITLLAISLLVSLWAAGQSSVTYMLYGHVADLITRAPIDSAWVVRLDTALNPIDSVQSIRKGMDGRDGGFMFGGRYPRGTEFMLKVSHPDYHTLTLPVKLKSKEPLPVIYLKRSMPRTDEMEGELSEVTVKATRLKFYYRGDTLVYDAAAFQLPEGSMLDDLIRQLPGAELRKNGEIFVNGRKVDQLLLQGKRLFNDNRQLILENLPYLTVKSIKVFETEGSALSPLDREYVMDVNLKKEYATGIIANAEAGLGTDWRYMGRAFLLGMTERSMASGYVNSNNLNDVAKPGERGNWNPQRAGDGVPVSTLAGVRYEAKNKTGSTKADGSVDFSATRKDVESASLRENYLTGGSTFQSTFRTERHSHLSLDTRHQLDLSGLGAVVEGLRLSPTLNYSKYDNKNRQASALFNENVTAALGKDWVDSIVSPQAGSLLFAKSINRLLTEDQRRGHALNAGIGLNPNIGLLSRYRTYTFFNYDYANSASEDFEHYNLDFPSQPAVAPDFRNNYTDRGEVAHSFSAVVRKNIQTQKPIRERYTADVMPSYRYLAAWGRTHDRRYLLHQLSDWSAEEPALGMLPSMAELLTVQDKANGSWQRTLNQRHTVEATVHFTDFKRKNFSLYLNLPLNVYVNRLNYHRADFFTRVYKRWVFVEPRLELKYKEHSRNYELKYDGRALTYDLVNMIPLSDTSNPLNIFTGNPDLSAGYRNSLSLSVRSDLSGQRAYNAGIACAVSSRSLAMGYVYDRATGVKNIMPQTVNGNWNTDLHAGYSCPLDRPHRLMLGSSASALYHRSVDMIGVTSTDGTKTASARSTVGTLYTNAMLRLDYRLLDKHSIGLKGDLHYMNSSSRRADFTTVNAFDYDYSLVAKIELPFKFQLATDITMYSRRGYSDQGMNTDDLIWNARLTKRVLKGKLLLMLDGFDILGNLSNVRRSINAQGRTETYYNVISRYAMLHAQYTFTPRKK